MFMLTPVNEEFVPLITKFKKLSSTKDSSA
jgi:hypothetical protein